MNPFFVQPVIERFHFLNIHTLSSTNFLAHFHPSVHIYLSFALQMRQSSVLYQLLSQIDLLQSIKKFSKNRLFFFDKF